MANLQDQLVKVETFQQFETSSDLLHIESQAVKAVKDVAFGSTAGILAKYVEYPFDTVKVRLQSQGHGSTLKQLHGPMDAFKAAFQSQEGPIRSLYRGISAPLIGAAVETSSLFFSYRLAQEAWISLSPDLRRERDANHGRVDMSFAALLGCGAISGACTSTLLTPIELVKCRMQVPHERPAHKLPGPFQIIASIFRSQGISGFWHGQVGTLIRETGGSAAWFGSYEGVKILFLRHDRSLNAMDEVRVWQQLVAGAAAGMSYNFVFYPADTIKSRMQTEDTSMHRSKGSFLEVGKELWTQQGLRGFYRGCGITVARAAPSSAIIFSIYEGLKRYFA